LQNAKATRAEQTDKKNPLSGLLFLSDFPTFLILSLEKTSCAIALCVCHAIFPPPHDREEKREERLCDDPEKHLGRRLGPGLGNQKLLFYFVCTGNFVKNERCCFGTRPENLRAP